jgi:hypothetical protein
LFIVSVWTSAFFSTSIEPHGSLARFRYSAYYCIIIIKKPNKTLGSPDFTKWWVPRNIELTDRDGDACLVWRRGQSKQFRQVSGSRSAVLLEFARLRSANDGAILAFARKYGVLGLCLHGRPFTHARPRFGPEELHGTGMRSGCEPLGKEFLRDWRLLSAEIHAVVVDHRRLGSGSYFGAMVDRNITAQAAESIDRKIGMKDPEAAFERKKHALRKQVRNALSQGSRERLINTSRRWVNDSGLFPEWQYHVIRSRKRSSISTVVQPAGLFDALALQLLLMSTQSESLKACSECGMFFVRRRRERKGLNTFCPGCGRPAANRAAQRKFRTKNPGIWRKYRKEKTHG